MGVPREQLDYVAAGHQPHGVVPKIEKDGVDLYPKLRANFEKPEYYLNEKVRGEVMRHFGYFMTESTGHLSEYLPWFRKNKKALDLYCDEPSFGGETGAYYKWCRDVSQKYQEVDSPSTGSPGSWSPGARNTAPTSWRPPNPEGRSSSTETS